MHDPVSAKAVAEVVQILDSSCQVDLILYVYANYFVASRRLHLFLWTLLNGEEGRQSGGASNREKEIFAAIASILHSVKGSEDVVDGAKSKVGAFYIM